MSGSTNMVAAEDDRPLVKEKPVVLR